MDDKARLERIEEERLRRLGFRGGKGSSRDGDITDYLKRIGAEPDRSIINGGTRDERWRSGRTHQP